jgi:CelD/BcsL family acetyltransferase involved in cellulose biosynthesis
MPDLVIDDLREPGLYARLYARCPDWTLYHTPEWLDFLDAAVPGRRLELGIWRGPDLVGLFPARERQLGPFRLFASPMPGWNTAQMGPIWLVPVESEEFWAALERFLKARRFHHTELVSADPRLWDRPGWQREVGHTFLAPLDPDPKRLLAGFGKSCRKIVRRAQRLGVRTEFTEDEKFIDIYYGQLEEVFAKRNLRPTYSKERVRLLWRHLKPTGRLLTAWAILDGQVIATRIDLVGNARLHSFGSASHRPALKAFPNEALRYFVMAWAGRNGMTTFDMTGGGTYKTKFGGRLADEIRLIRSPAMLRLGRRLARWAFYRLKRGARRATEEEANEQGEPNSDEATDAGPPGA